MLEIHGKSPVLLSFYSRAFLHRFNLNHLCQTRIDHIDDPPASSHTHIHEHTFSFSLFFCYYFTLLDSFYLLIAFIDHQIASLAHDKWIFYILFFLLRLFMTLNARLCEYFRIVHTQIKFEYIRNVLTAGSPVSAIWSECIGVHIGVSAAVLFFSWNSAEIFMSIPSLHEADFTQRNCNIYEVHTYATSEERNHWQQ